MHQEALDYVARMRPEFAGDVLDVGGRDVNGTPRGVFTDAATYIAVDLVAGPGVDLVGDICAMGFEDFADTVLCLEVLEHAENWRGVVAACAAAVRPGGTVLITCAGPGREPHSASDGGPLLDGEYYMNVAADELFDAMFEAGLVTTTAQSGGDTRACGRRV